MNTYTFTKKIIYGLLGGCIISSLYIQNSDRCAKALTVEIQKIFKRDFKAHFLGELTTVSLFPAALTLKNVCVVPVDYTEKWDWKAEQIDVSFSLLSYFFTKKIGFEMNFYNPIIHSSMIDNQPSIKKHIDTYFTMSSIAVPLVPEKVHAYNAHILIRDKPRFQKCALFVDGSMIWKNEKMSGKLLCRDGIFSFHDEIFIKNIQGTVSFDTKKLYQKCLYPVTTTVSFKVPFLPQEKQTFVLNGEWDGYKGNCLGNNEDSSFIVKKALIMYQHKNILFDINAQCDCSLGAYFVGFNDAAQDFSGTATIALSGTPQAATGIMNIQSMGYNSYVCDKAELFFITDKKDMKGTVTFSHKNQRGNGNFVFDLFNQTGTCALQALTPWNVFKEWNLNPSLSHLACFVNEGNFLCEHEATITHKKTENCVHEKGEIKLFKNGLLDFKGIWSEKMYQGKMEFLPTIKPHFFSCKDKQGTTLFTVTGHYPDYTHFDARFSYKLLREAMSECFDYDIPGEGNIVCTGKVKKDSVKIAVHSQDITISVPETYNFISEINAEALCYYDPLSLDVTHVLLSLHKGMIQSKGMVFEWDDQGNLKTVNATLHFENCFLNVKKDFFALISGDIALKKQKDADFLLNGSVEIKKGQLKENPFSFQGQKKVTQGMMPSHLFENIPLNLSLKLFSHHPVHINTPFVTSQALLDLDIHNTLVAPLFSGSLKFNKGALHFPYKSLSIIHADIHFLPHQSYDPLIHIVARAMVKKYTITLSVTGSLETPHITLDSVPYLAEEQILALLFTGTVEDTLPGMVPVFVVHSLEKLLFGSNQYTDSSNSLLKDSLKKIRLVPRFSDQTGRGGIRGAIEIDVSNRLHAMIQKNFSLSEDTRFEVEYIISDDMSVKGIKDERGDIGGELEMRFKL
ncbi:translocation/assembly module TamB [Candidatus Babeliales bacterium]|nr:translocation/assembly module TamB [Candidatus Babeliales bacterium]